MDKGTKMLVVDDEPLAVKGLRATIAQVEPGAEVTGFTTSSEALAWAQKNGADIAFLDIEMPGMGGVELGKKLQELCPGVNIIFVTGYNDRYAQAMNMHASGYILKPATREAVIKELSDLRHPVRSKEEKRIRIRTFGDFQIFIDRMPVSFRYKKTAELMAYLVDRRGALCSNGMIIAALWEDESDVRNKSSYLRNLRQDLLTTLGEYGLSDVVITHRSEMGIKTESIKCDYYDYLSGAGGVSYHGEYMNQYSWAESTNGILTDIEQTGGRNR